MQIKDSEAEELWKQEASRIATRKSLDKGIETMHETGDDRLTRYEQPLGSGIVDATDNDPRKIRRSRRSEARTLRFLAPIALTSVLLFVAALTIFVATSLLWDMPLGTGTRQVVMNTFNGMLLSVPVLLSLWLVLGGQTWIIRIPLATFSLLALLGVYLATINFQSSSVPVEVFWISGGTALAVSVAVQIPLWIVRAWRGVSICRSGSESVQQQQFTIKQLLITTTIVAFIVPFLQWFATFESFTKTPTSIPLARDRWILRYPDCGVGVLNFAFSIIRLLT